jgi:hypothetical protein
MTKQAEQIVNVLAEINEEPQQIAPQALASAQAIRAEIVPQLKSNPAYAPLWQAFRAQPQEQKPVLAGIVQVLIQTDPALDARLQALLQQYQVATQGTGQQINTGGGAYIGGNVDTGGGTFTGRDSYHVEGVGNVIGDNVTNTVIQQQGTDAVALAQAFGELYARVQQDQQLSEAEQAAAQKEIAALQQAATAQGEQVTEGFVHTRLQNLQRMAPDILDVVLATFANPVAGAGMVIKKIAEKMKADTT